MINILIVVSDVLFDSPGLAIIALTIIVNLIILPLTLKQIKSSKAMQDLQPKMLELTKKYAKDKDKLAKEQMQLYREAGMSPAGCVVPMLVQMPIWFALYQAVMKLLATSPDNFLDLGRFLYSWPQVFSVLPLNNRFLWFDLGTSDTILVLPLLVGATMWVQQKMSTVPSADPRQQSQSQMMLWMMPIMFAWLAMSFPSGLALYWVTSSLIRIGIQYYTAGWGGLLPQKKAKQAVVTKKE